MFGVDDLILGGLSLGGSLLSGFGAQSSAKKQAKIEAAYQYQNYLLQVERNRINKEEGDSIIARYDPVKNLVPDAQAAGFNPVTWAGAMGGMYSALTGYGHQLRIGTDYMQSAPTTQVPSTMSVLGGAISAGASALGTSYRSNQQILASKQNAMLGFLGQVQMSRARGNSLAGLGTPFFEITGQQLTLPSGGGAAAALSLGSAAVPMSRAAKQAATNAYTYDVPENPTGIANYIVGDRSIPNIDKPTGTWHDYWTNFKAGRSHMTQENYGLPYDAFEMFNRRLEQRFMSSGDIRDGIALPSDRPAPRDSAIEANKNRLPEYPDTRWQAPQWLLEPFSWSTFKFGNAW